MSGCGRYREAIPAWVAGELEPEAAARVASHVRECPACAGLASAARTVHESVAPLGAAGPPRRLVERVAADPCRRWRRCLVGALDGPLPEPAGGRLARHLESCAACRAVWESLLALHEVRAALSPPPRSVLRAAAIPGARRAVRVPALPTVSAAAYVLALATALLLGNPVTLARQEARNAVSRLGRVVEVRLDAAVDEGRGEVRLLVYRAWTWAGRTAAAIREVFHDELQAPPGPGPNEHGGTP